jgi:hypothetical protein
LRIRRIGGEEQEKKMKKKIGAWIQFGPLYDPWDLRLEPTSKKL